MKKQTITKILILVLLLFVLSPTLLIGYGFWNNLSDTHSNTIMVGEWWNGTPISTAQEFYDMATNSNSSSDDSYYLTNDIDFSGFNWQYNSNNDNLIFRGMFDGGGYTISNLTIDVVFSYSTYYADAFVGIFPRMDGGTIQNLNIDDLEVSLDYYSLRYGRIVSGGLIGRVTGSGNVIDDITMNSVYVRGTSSTYGVGTLVGDVNSNGELLIQNVKGNDLQVFSTYSYSGGLVGSLSDSSAAVTIQDIDIEGNVYADSYNAYTGGVVGYIYSSASLTLSRAIVEMYTENNLENSYSQYSYRYLGGLIGYNRSTSDRVIITDTFFTGGLITDYYRQNDYVGTVIGRSTGSENVTNSYYAKVLFRDDRGSIGYDVNIRPNGVMSTLVDSNNLPSTYWWQSFSAPFIFANDLWNLDSTTGRLYLIR
ncbi:MAG: hypothetical protein JXB08_01990 [Bacilli bacterium]|nr:hypothetical protein [Bacilli bacterium]MBN2877986.1 hypothetical protein [Bacilli bacterium]